MKNILIVDDSDSFRRLLRTKLEESGFAVLEAKNGVEALSIVAGENVDLVILDLDMPELSGVNFVYKLKTTTTRELPIVILTNMTVASYQEDVKEFLTKANTSLEKVVETVRKYLD
jgi:CheY-like chemotaxis protein